MVSSWLLALLLSTAVGLLLRQLLPPMVDGEEDPDGW
jgi:hypothetical protein